MLEPYSSQKHILYMVLSPGGETFSDTLKTFFCNLSVTYKVCNNVMYLYTCTCTCVYMYVHILYMYMYELV